MRQLLTLFVTLTIAVAAPLLADGPSDNKPESVRPIPPAGIRIDDQDRQRIQEQWQRLNRQIDELRALKDSAIQRHLPDVEIFSKAIRIALDEDGFFEPVDVDRANQVLQAGLERVQSIKAKQFGWKELSPTNRAIVRGFRSKLDGSVQPYGVVHSLQSTNSTASYRADIWCRGRSEKGLEMQFLATRATNLDPVPERDVIMIHPFGRYCNANKLAGEVDTLEALEHAISEYPIDTKRVAIRGFSMGGAAAWHLAVHYPDRWFAANPGAGFSETPEFLNVFQSETLKPYPFEQTLWQMYDCPVWVRNLRMLPTIAYSGEIDKQKQAADIMAKASEKLPDSDRFELTHIIAPRTAHQVSPAARADIESRLATIDSLRLKSKPDRWQNFQFTTTTLKYNQARGLTVLGLDSHWSPGTIWIEYESQSQTITVVEDGITEFALELPADGVPLHAKEINIRVISVNRKIEPYLTAAPLRSDLSWKAHLKIDSGAWRLISSIEESPKTLRKQHDLQGPIDDALMSPFVFVKPTQAGQHPNTDAWVQSEMNRAVREWHRQMRGDARMKSSEELTNDDLEKYNLILWGDPTSNPTIQKILDRLPIHWDAQRLVVNGTEYTAANHVPILIFPNPLNPTKYVVLNSSFTYREYDYLNNARQVPKLPDWVVLNIETPPNARWPGALVAGDFFDEQWRFKSADGKISK